MSELLEKPFMKIRVLYPTKLIRFQLFFCSMLSILLISIMFLHILFSGSNDLFLDGFIILCISFLIPISIIILILFLKLIHIEPLILFKNGIIPHESNFKKKELEQRRFIHFKDIANLYMTESSKNWTIFSIKLKNNNYVYQNVNNKDDWEFIKNIFYSYKTNYDYTQKYDYLNKMLM